eukprot:scaffold5159_cov112-Cylindrotheca_fusiformis.AAC.29
MVSATSSTRRKPWRVVKQYAPHVVAILLAAVLVPLLVLERRQRRLAEAYAQHVTERESRGRPDYIVASVWVEPGTQATLNNFVNSKFGHSALCTISERYASCTDG